MCVGGNPLDYCGLPRHSSAYGVCMRVYGVCVRVRACVCVCMRVYASVWV